MLQELFRIPGLDLPIYGYGFMLVVGFLAAAHLAKYLANRNGLDGEVFINAALLALFTGVLGARLSHVLENLSDYTDPNKSAWHNFLSMINLRQGGLTFYGGFLLALPTLIFYAVKKRIPLRVGMDIAAPCIMVGLAFGRVGCFLNGCCFGATCELPWAITFPYQSLPYDDHYHHGLVDPPPALTISTPTGERLATIAEAAQDPTLRTLARAERSAPVHPAQLYSAFNAFLIAGILFAYLTLPHLAGRVFALMLVLKGISRFLLEMVRTEPPVKPEWFGPLSISMVISIGLVLLGIALWFLFSRPPAQARTTTA
jgi:phosphatidylglycerol:prolipoprotein diacylglycerol transferase